MIRSLKKAVYVLIPLIVYIVVHDIVRILLMFVLQVTAQHSQAMYEVVLRNNAAFSGIISVLDMLAAAAAVMVLLKFDGEELAPADYFNVNGLSFYRRDRLHPAWVSWALIIICGLLWALGLNIFLNLTGISGFSEAYSETADAQYSLPIGLGIVIYGLISPAVEEFVFRLAVFGRMKRRFPFVIAVLASSLFFGLYHENLVQGIYGTVMGIIMCLACEYVHSVLGAFAVHSTANLCIYILGCSGKLSSLNNTIACVTVCAAALISLAVCIFFMIRSEKKAGMPEGVAPVGCFYIDPSLDEDYEGDYEEDHHDDIEAYSETDRGADPETGSEDDPGDEE